MATTVDITLAGASGKSINGVTMPIADSVPIDTDVITAGAAATLSDFAVPDGATGLFWIITVVGGNARIKFDNAPTAVAGEGGGWLVLASTTREWSARPGDKASVIAAEV
jgi:hypothetical protein